MNLPKCARQKTRQDFCKHRASIAAAIVAASICGCAAKPENASLSPSGTGNDSAAISRLNSGSGSGSGSTMATPATRETSASEKEIIATINNVHITRAQLEKALLSAYGLNMLAKISELEYAKNEAMKRNIIVLPEDVRLETDRYLASLFNEDKDPVLHQLNDQLTAAEEKHDDAKATSLKEDLARERNQLLDRLLQQQKVTRTDFDLVMETNTNLRKIAESLLSKEPLTDDQLKQAFNLEYGEKVQLRDIEVANLQEATEVRRRLSTGESFEDVAHAMSRNQQSAALGGELPAFNHENPNLPQQFRDVAFALKIGEVSDAVAVESSYHILKLERRIPPKLVKFEDVREGVREFLHDRQLEAVSKDLRTKLQQEVSTDLKVADPELKKQYDQQVNQKTTDAQNKNDVRREYDLRRSALQTTRPTTVP